MRRKILVFNLVLGGVIALLFLLNFYHRTMFFRPNPVHQWRQSDCLSIAKNYYEEGMRFFEPKIHNQLVEGGKAVSECPILNYSVAALWKVFGEHEFIYRLLEYLLFISAVYFSFNTLLSRCRNGWVSLLLPAVLLTSPLLVYYSFSFLADVPALSLGIMAFCSLYRFSMGGSQRNYYLAVLLGTLAVLIKASALVPLGLTFLTGLSLLSANPAHHLARARFRNKTIPVVISLISIIVVIAWYRFAINYNNNDTTNIFLLTILPVWEMGEEQVLYNLKKLFNDFFPAFLNRPMLFFVTSLAIYVTANFRKLEKLLRWSFVCSGLFFVLYILVFYQVFNVHDYYLINLFFFPVVTVFCAVILFEQNALRGRNSATLKWIVALMFLFNGMYAAAFYRSRTIPNDNLVEWFPFISQQEKELADYLFWRYSIDLGRVEDLTPALRAAGISRYDKVMSIPDESLNISLYLMDQKGHPIGRYYMENDSAAMDEYLGEVKYVVLSDTMLKNTIAFKKNRERLSYYFTYGAVQVFKTRH